VTEPSFLEARGLGKVVAPHGGPASAARLVEKYGCHVHPLRLGTKAPATEHGTSDAVLSAAAITGNYGVNAAKSQIVAVDLDDYVPDNLCDEFLAEFELPPTFTVRTGSGGRSLWYRAPGDVTLRQKLGMWTGVDIKAGNSYVLGPGNKLAGSELKPGATGDGTYSFDKDSPKEFAPLPQKLVDALTVKPATVSVQSTGESAEYAELSDSLKERADQYARDSIARELETVRALGELGDNERNSDDDGWESGTWHAAGAIASLVKASWNAMSYDDVIEQWREAVPGDGSKWHSHGVGMLPRTMVNDDFPARVWPKSIEEELDWWVEGTYRQVGFREAGGSDEAPPAEPVVVEEDPNDWPKEAWNEEGHVQRGARWSAGALRWLKDEETWVTYDQIRWVRDKTAGAYAVQQGMKVARWTELKNYDATPQVDEKTGQAKPNSSEQDKFVKALSDQSTSMMFDRASRALALSGELTALSTDFDRDPLVIGALNGVVDLRTGELTPPAPELMVSHVAPVRFDPAATAPRFLQYLEESLPDPEVRSYLKRVMGYSITGSVAEQVMFIHHGKTSNGKSVLFKVLSAALGEYAGGADPKALIETRNEQHSAHIASLYGPRFLTMSETARGARLSDVLIKNITGADTVTARKLYKENEDLEITGKIHMATNHLPHIVSSPSTNRRIQLIHWPVEIAEEKIDLQLASKLIANELEGIFTWLVEGAVEWWTTLADAQGKPVRRGGRPSGLAMPHQVLVDTANYLRGEDDILEWLEERTETSDAIESTGNLYRDYRTWAEARGVRSPLTQRAFTTDLETSGELERGRTNDRKGFKVALKPLQKTWFQG
jgi:putative DNA primase/helicase